MTVREPLQLVALPRDVVPEYCITCSDEGRIGRVVAMPATAFAPALVKTQEGLEEVDVTLVDAAVDRYVLIHAGGAISMVDELTEAQIEVLA